MNLSENLKKIRKEHHLSQEQLAEKLGVSRQSVSKWESELAYPELDKIIQISTLFNINVDDLLNQNIEEVVGEKQSAVRMNKILDSFLSYITKSIDMFSSMKLKSKLKCIFEQIIIISILFCFFLVLGSVGNYIVNGLFSSLPRGAFRLISSILESIYMIISIILGTTLFFHIFKIRYLDYYEIVNQSIDGEDPIQETENTLENDQNLEKKKNKIFLEKKKERIIIRNPEGKDYKFIKGLLKIVVFFLKFILSMIAFGVCLLLIGLVMGFVSTFLIFQTGFFFVGLATSFLAMILLTLIALIIMIHIIIHRKSNKKVLLYSFLASLIVFGAGLGLTFIGFMKFQYIEDLSKTVHQVSTINIAMKHDLILDDEFCYDCEIEFVEEDRSDIQIEMIHSDITNIQVRDDHSHVFFQSYYAKDFIAVARRQIRDINKFQIVDYSRTQIKVYLSSKNLAIINENRKVYYDQKMTHEKEIRHYLERQREYERTISKLEEENLELKSRNEELESIYQEQNENE